MKKGVIIIGLAIAFVAASAWVVLSGGKSAKAIRTKFRLGGAILTLTGIAALSSCETGVTGVTTCYDPAPPVDHIPPAVNDVYALFPTVINEAYDVHNGAVLPFSITLESEEDVIFVISTPEGEELQRVRYLSDNNQRNEFNMIVDVGAWRGVAELHIYFDYAPELGIFVEHSHGAYLLNIID